MLHRLGTATMAVLSLFCLAGIPWTIADGAPWWTVACCVLGFVGWGIAALDRTTAFTSPLSHWFHRRHARWVREMAEIFAVLLERQGNDRPEVLDQTEWLRDSLTAHVATLTAIEVGEKRVSNAEWDALFSRVMVDALPALEQHAADNPSPRVQRMVRSARREAAKLARA